MLMVKRFLILIILMALMRSAYSFDEDSEVSIGVKRGAKINKNTNVPHSPKKNTL
ncbi:MAG: hypothetical protein OEV44_10830 [Spirochaetota bacterium]|nr:hypothetical protein [Spirochaetota bacterium]